VIIKRKKFAKKIAQFSFEYKYEKDHLLYIYYMVMSEKKSA